MEEHDEFDKELESAPKNADPYLIILPYNKTKSWYEYKHIDLEHAEGVITRDDLKYFLQMFKKGVLRALHKGNYSVIDATVILIVLICVVCLALAIYFAIGNKFEGLRAAAVLVTSIVIFFLLIFSAYSCIRRAKVNKERVTQLEAVIEKAQNEIFSKKGAILTLSPLESYITIEMCWKYSRLALHATAADAETEPKMESLVDFNSATIDDSFSKFNDQELAQSIRLLATRIPEKKETGQEGAPMDEKAESVGSDGRIVFHKPDTEKYMPDYSSISSNSLENYFTRIKLEEERQKAEREAELVQMYQAPISPPVIDEAQINAEVTPSLRGNLRQPSLKPQQPIGYSHVDNIQPYLEYEQ